MYKSLCNTYKDTYIVEQKELDIIDVFLILYRSKLLCKILNVCSVYYDCVAGHRHNTNGVCKDFSIIKLKQLTYICLM